MNSPVDPPAQMPSHPSELANCRVICLNAIDGRHEVTADATSEVAGAVCGPASFLAICAEDTEGVFLFFCDAQWNIWNDSWFQTPHGAIDFAETQYRGTASTWETPSGEKWDPGRRY